MISSFHLKYLCLALLISAVAPFTFGQETNSLGMKFRFMEGGRYLRGTDARQRGLEQDFPLSINAQFFGNPEYPAHYTWITKPFYIAECEVTVGQWKKFVAATGYTTTAEKNGQGIIGWSPTSEDLPLYKSHDFERRPEFTWKNPGFEQSDDHPVVGVSFEDVTAFLEWLSKKEGVTYRLPTEAEWEFACRAGSDTWFSFGDDARGTVHRHANIGNVELEKHRKHSVERQWLLDWENDPEDGFVFTSPVGSKEPNAFGLADMHGNVWEWCSDLWLDTFYKRYDWPKRGLPRKVAVDPVNESEPQTPTNRFRSIRGGCWYNGPIICRSSNRTYWDEPDAACYLGFRVVRDADPSKSTDALQDWKMENTAREAIVKAGGTFHSDRGLNIEIRFDRQKPFDSSVCVNFANIPGLEKLSLAGKGTTTLSTGELDAIAQAQDLRTIDFSTGFDLASADLSVLARLPQLDKLLFSRSTSITDADLAKLAGLKHLQEFPCYGLSGAITDAGVSHLKNNRDLRNLNLRETGVTGSFLKQFAGCPLESLSITRAYGSEPKLTDENFRHVAAFPALQSLHLTGQSLLTDAAVEVIGSLKEMDTLTLFDCSGISPEGFAPLKELQKLRSLNLQQTAAADAALAHLATIPRLEDLRLGNSEITDNGYREIAKIFSLQDLYIDTSSATDEGLKALGRINRLQRLDIGSDQITGSGLGPLCRLPNLNDLRLRCPALTDEAFTHLSRGKSLLKIRLANRGTKPAAALTDEGIMQMARAGWVKELWLPRNDTGITEEGIAKLNKLMPKTEVIPYTVDWK